MGSPINVHKRNASSRWRNLEKGLKQAEEENIDSKNESENYGKEIKYSTRKSYMKSDNDLVLTDRVHSYNTVGVSQLGFTEIFRDISNLEKFWKEGVQDIMDCLNSENTRNNTEASVILSDVDEDVIVSDEKLLKEDSDLIQVECNQCEYKAVDIHTMKLHVNEKHYDKVVDVQKNSSEKYDANISRNVTPENKSLEPIIQSNLIYSCKECDYKVDSTFTLQNHMKTNHLRFTFELCPSNYISKHNLKRHFKSKHKKARFSGDFVQED